MLIELTTFDYKILILFIFPIFKRIGDYTKQLYVKEDTILFKTFRYYICYIFSVILSFILNKKNSDNFQLPNENKDLEEILSPRISTINLIDELMQKNIKNRKLKSFLFLMLLSVISLFTNLYINIYNRKEFIYSKQSIGIFFYIFFFILLSFILLKQKMYRHHLASSITIAIILLILFIITIYIKRNDIFHSFIFYLIYSLSFSLYDILGKKYMNVFYNSPYFMMSIIGVICSTSLIIFDLFAFFLNRDISGIIIGFQKNIINVVNVLEFILDIAIKFIWNLGIWLTIYYFSPCHYFISGYISDYINYIIIASNSSDDFYSSINISIFTIAYLINFFCCLVFNEVIILNFWKLDYNTKKRIRERMKLDTQLLFNDGDDDSNIMTFNDENDDEST